MLVQCLSDPVLRVRQSAIVALGMLHDATSFEPLSALLTDQTVETRARAVWAIGELHDERTIPPLINCLFDKQPVVRLQAVKALGALGNPQALAQLLTVLKVDEDSATRAEVVSVLCNFERDKVIPTLLNCIKDHHLLVRKGAILAPRPDCMRNKQCNHYSPKIKDIASPVIAEAIYCAWRYQ